jgi:hypothetical protein
MRRFISLVVFAPVLCAQVKELKPGFNLFSPQQDIQLGQEAAAQVEKSMQVVKNDELTSYMTRIGARLAKSPRAGTFPFKFAVVNDKSVNAFALPGGPMFVHTGLIALVDNEAELAGVLAHEMSHVALRHGTHEASKANILQIPAALAGAVVGNGGGMLGQLAQLGIGLGTQSLLLKYSRSAEHDADINGTRMLLDAGYNPQAMAQMFEKLEKLDGASARTSDWLSDHPSPGNRVQYVDEEIKHLPPVNRYSELEPSTLTKAKAIVAKLPDPPKQAAPQQAAVAGAPAAPSVVRPSGRTLLYQSKAFTVSYPDNWQTFGEQDGSAVTIAPKEALLQGARGQTQIGYGMMASFYFPQTKDTDLGRLTDLLVGQLGQGNTSLHRGAGKVRAITVGAKKGLVSPLESASPYKGETEVDMLLTVQRPEGVFYMILIAPGSEWSQVEGTFNSIVGSVRFPN